MLRALGRLERRVALLVSAGRHCKVPDRRAEQPGGWRGGKALLKHLASCEELRGQKMFVAQNWV